MLFVVSRRQILTFSALGVLVEIFVISIVLCGETLTDVPVLRKICILPDDGHEK